MERESVIEIVEGLGFLYEEYDPSPNGSHYDRYKNVFGDLIWIGNYYIESKHQPLAFSFKDKESTELELLKFLNLE